MLSSTTIHSSVLFWWIRLFIFMLKNTNCPTCLLCVIAFVQTSANSVNSLIIVQFVDLAWLRLVHPFVYGKLHTPFINHHQQLFLVHSMHALYHSHFSYHRPVFEQIHSIHHWAVENWRKYLKHKRTWISHNNRPRLNNVRTICKWQWLLLRTTFFFSIRQLFHPVSSVQPFIWQNQLHFGIVQNRHF